MPTERQSEDGRWLPVEYLPEPFGVLWGRLWLMRRERGQWKWVALFTSWRDARAISRMGS